MAGTSSGSSSSQSTSASYIPEYSQSPILSAIAQYAYQLGGQTYNWAQQAYAKMGAVTDANIGNYLQTSTDALNNAANAENEYKNVFQPEENQLVQDANTYSSQSRVAQEMGRAEAGAGQSADAARQNSLQNLMSYGIDPSAGRYAGLDRAEEMNKAASMAAAGQAAQYNTEATGRQLRADAIQVGETLPGVVTNAENTGLQGIAGAENSNLANANTGVALQNSANPYLTTASSLKYPPLGNSSQSTSASQNQSQSTDPPKDSSGGKQQGNGSGGGSGAGASPYSGGAGGGGSGSVGGSSFSSAPSSDGSSYDGSYGGSDLTGTYGLGGDGSYYNDGSYAGIGGTATDMGTFSNDGSLPDSSGFSDPSSYDYSSSTDGSSATGYGGLDMSGTNYTDSSGFGYDGGSYDSGGFDTSAGYARGGPVRPRLDRRPGGHVPPSSSPSGGMQVDDVHANLNAGEYVIPRDVVAYKGKEFFAKMIAQARKNAATLAARPMAHGVHPGQMR